MNNPKPIPKVTKRQHGPSRSTLIIKYRRTQAREAHETRTRCEICGSMENLEWAHVWGRGSKHFIKEPVLSWAICTAIICQKCHIECTIKPLCPKQMDLERRSFIEFCNRFRISAQAYKENEETIEWTYKDWHNHYLRVMGETIKELDPARWIEICEEAGVRP